MRKIPIETDETKAGFNGFPEVKNNDIQSAGYWYTTKSDPEIIISGHFGKGMDLMSSIITMLENLLNEIGETPLRDAMKSTIINIIRKL